MAVTQVFREYGPVYVKIRRDAKHMPFAFCQYTNGEDADRAIREGRGRLVRGRPCRCEKAKAHRKYFPILSSLPHRPEFDSVNAIAENSQNQVPLTVGLASLGTANKVGLFIIERKGGDAITPTEARLVLHEFGKIDRCYLASDLERATFKLGEAVIVQFEMYDNGQNAQSVSPCFLLTLPQTDGTRHFVTTSNTSSWLSLNLDLLIAQAMHNQLILLLRTTMSVMKLIASLFSVEILPLVPPGIRSLSFSNPLAPSSTFLFASLCPSLIVSIPSLDSHTTDTS